MKRDLPSPEEYLVEALWGLDPHEVPRTIEMPGGVWRRVQVTDGDEQWLEWKFEEAQ